MASIRSEGIPGENPNEGVETFERVSKRLQPLGVNSEIPGEDIPSFEGSVNQEPKLSEAMKHVVSEFSGNRVSASQIVASLLKRHGNDYANGKGRRLSLSEDASRRDRRPVTKWIEAVRPLYDQDKAPELNGRLVILGLSMLDLELAKELSANDFLKSLQEEVYPPFDSLLSRDGNKRWLSMLDYVDPSVQINSVPTHLDHPTKTDGLGRKVFAEILAQRIRTVRDKESSSRQRPAARVSLAQRIRTIRDKEIKAGNKDKDSFMVHIHGPWGSGKSSLLNFLGNELTRKDVSPRWVVVNFNAWEHQRLGRPWWWLMNALYKQGVRQLSLWRSNYLRLREFLWRSSRAGWPPYLLALLALAMLFWIMWLLHFFGVSPFGVDMTAGGPGKSQLQALAETSQSISAVIALIITVWGIIFGLSRSLLPGSVRATNTFMETTRDPMKALTRHFNAMVTNIKKPVAIFIDDIDRCQDSYVVELLEGIHTLFSERQVTYVVAADRRWIYASYEKAYATFADTVEEPGRPLRYLFLEKVFHLSTSVPPMTPTAQEAYWRSLIRVNQPGGQEELEKVRADVKQKLQGLNKEKEILEFVQSTSKKGNPIEEQYVREEAAKRLAAPEVEWHTEDVLSKYAFLMEANPRAMKRLVNAYGVQRAISTLVGVNIEMEQLALWTIVVLRWPLLAEYLERHPEMVERIGETLQDDVFESDCLRSLFQDEEVYNVIKGKGVGTCLDADAIRSCAYLRTPESSTGTKNN